MLLGATATCERLCMSTDAILARNRLNAQLSTGPRTEAGKLASRLNALKHGLTANPAAVGVEEAALFEDLHEQLCDDLQPRNQLERTIVHRMAVASWRLNRAAVVDAAVSAHRLDRVRTPQHKTQEYIQAFHDCFVWKKVEEQDPQILARARKAGLAKRGEKWLRLKRRNLSYLDRLRADMMACEAGVRAMMFILDDLWDKYLHVDKEMGNDGMHKLAWALGDGPSTIPAIFAETPFGGGHVLKEIGESATPVGLKFELLSKAWPEVDRAVAPPTVASLVKARMDALTQQLNAVSDSFEWEQEAQLRQLALLPNAKTLDRQQRYESAAERSLYRAIDQLARLRGMTIERIASSVTGVRPDGSTVQITGERTTVRQPPTGSAADFGD